MEQAAGILIIPVILTNIWQAFFGTAFRLVIARLWTLQLALVVGSLISALLIVGVDTAVAAAENALFPTPPGGAHVHATRVERSC